MEKKTKGGPKTNEGKEISRYNAIKHGLLTKEVLIDGEDEKALMELKETVHEQLNPVGPIEALLTDRIISSFWRLRRAIIVETATMKWYQEDLNMFPLGQDEAQQERQNIKNMLSNESIETILRYETTIERSIFRALHELERVQAKRNGKDIPPPAVVDVNVDSSFRKNDL
jgi:hypothetical protein